MLARHSSHDPHRGGHAKIDHVPVPPTRRLVLTGALGAGVAALTGCGVRLEDDAPDIPFVPRREPIPGEIALLAMLAALTSEEGELAHERATILRTALLAADVPEKELDAADAPVSPAEVVAAHEGALRECGPGLLTLVGQLSAVRIRADDALWARPDPTAWALAEVAAASLQATRATVYALDFIAAQGGKRTGQRAEETLAVLRRLSVRQTTAAGDAVSGVTLGYELDVERLTPTAATRLARRSLLRAVGVYSDTLARLSQDREGALETAHWMATVQGLAESWGAKPTALIGDEA